MTKGLLLVFSKPVSDDRDDAYNRWYDGTHLQDVTGVEGFVSGARYRISEQQMREGSSIAGLPYLAAYEIDAEDPKTAIQNLLSARAGFFREQDTIDSASVVSVFFEQITEPVTAASGAASGQSAPLTGG